MQQRAIPGSPRSLRASLSFDDVESPGKLKAAFQLLRVRRRRALVLLALLSLLPLRWATHGARARAHAWPPAPHCAEPLPLMRHEVRVGGFQMDGYHVWGGSAVFAPEDGRWHLFASRWPASLGHNAWVTSSEVVRATADAPDGPYTFEEVVLGPRDPGFFDGRMAHNPTVHRDPASGRYFLFYIGTTYAFEPPRPPVPFDNRTQYELAWNGKRIGVATATSARGPWRRKDETLLPPRPGMWDGGITSNPSVVIHGNGSATLMYKSMKHTYPERTAKKDSFYLGVAFSKAGPWGPFVRTGPSWNRPAVSWAGRPLTLEDPFLWRCGGGTWHLLAKTMGRIDALGLRDAQLIYTNSSDLEAWAEPQLAYNRTLTFRGGGGAARTAHVARLERPQLIFADGPDAAPSHGLFGLMERKQGTCRNVAVPFGRAA